MSNAKVEFIKSLYCAAKTVGNETGMSWEVILAQAAQETAWGDKVLAGTHNIFNIKASHGWTGETKTFRVWEMENGHKIWVDAPFRVYADFNEALRDRIAFLQSNPRYAKAGLFDAGTKGTLSGEAAALQKAGYATDPSYAANLEAVFNGRTMQTAIKEAEAAGCDCCKGASIIKVTDAARTPLAGVKVKIKSAKKEIITTTSKHGEIGVKAPESPIELALEIWNELRQIWFPANKKIKISSEARVHTLVSPHIVFKAKTTPHAPKASASPGSASSHTAHGAIAHVIRRGETLGGIAHKHHMSYHTLARFNHIKPPYRILAGHTLQIPGKPTKHDPPPKVQPAQTHILPAQAIAGNPTSDIASASRAPWLEFAEHELALHIRRHGGEVSNEHIREYAKATSLGATKDATYAYCAAFANWCLVKAGYAGTNNAMAISFKNWGRATKGGKPAFGAIAVVRWPNGQHHVTFVTRESKTGGVLRYTTLGGNQGSNNAVSESSVRANLVLALRYPSDYPDRDEDYELQSKDSANMPGMSSQSTR
jgi:uncharacterized protein (TIGR02594 family)